MKTRLEAVRVQEVILNNETNPERYEELGGHDAVGTILYSNLKQVIPVNGSTDNLNFARPLFSNITQYPLVNEVVYLVRGPSETYCDDKETIAYYMSALKLQNHPLHNAFPDIATNTSEEQNSINFGEYFTEIEKIRPLRPYEGDTIIEGRYGNTIRLGATTPPQLVNPNRWSNEGEIGNPITIIRNGQKEDELGESFEHILEDIDNDNSSIYLCSNQQLSYFAPASEYNASFGAEIRPYSPIEPETSDEPITEETQEDTVLSPVELEEEIEEVVEEEEEEEREEIADYDEGLSENQALFPEDDLGDSPYPNPEGIDLGIDLD